MEKDKTWFWANMVTVRIFNFQFFLSYCNLCFVSAKTPMFCQIINSTIFLLFFPSFQLSLHLSNENEKIMKKTEDKIQLLVTQFRRHWRSKGMREWRGEVDCSQLSHVFHFFLCGFSTKHWQNSHKALLLSPKSFLSLFLLHLLLINKMCRYMLLHVSSWHRHPTCCSSVSF